MTISKSKFFLLLTFALAAPVIAVIMYMDVPFGMQAGSLESSPSLTSASTHEATEASCDVAVEEGGEFEARHFGSGAGEQGDFATNSGEISDAQFNDGGFGDIGQQWWNVNVAGPVINVHISGNDNTSVVTVGEAILEGEGSSAGTSTPIEEEPAPPSSTTSTTVPPTTTTTLAPPDGD